MTNPHLAGVSSATLIVPGVGDHGSGGVLNNVRKVHANYLSALGLPPKRLQDVDLSHFLPSDCHTSLALRGLRIRLRGEEHLIATLIWSHTRKRLGTQAKDDADTESGLRQRICFAIGSSVIALKDWCYLLLPESWGLSRLWVRVWAFLTLAAFSFYFLCLLTAVVLLSVLYFQFRTPNFAWSGLHKFNFLPSCSDGDRPMIILTLILLIIFPLVTFQILATWDLLIDVISYVANARRRMMLVETLSQIITKVDQARGGIPLILVGHSLGSVLLTHAIPDLSGGPAVLVTCGSPLDLMARGFPSVVSTGQAIGSRILGSSRVQHWINLYRDADYVGRSLKVGNSPAFSENSIGDGGHANYFSDARFWRAVQDIISSPAGEISWRDGNSPVSSEDDEQERLDLSALIFLSPFVALLSGALDIYVWFYYLRPEGALPLLCISLPYVLACIAASLFSVAGIAAVSIFLKLRQSRSGKLPLNDLRLWRGPIWLMTLSCSLFSLAALAFCLLKT
jgi:hypothetical protein